MKNIKIFEALRMDHSRQRDLLEALVKTHGASAKRDELFRALITELQEHARYEEQYLYQPILNIDLTQKKARHSLAEHHQIDELIEQLKNEEMSSPNWLKTAKTLQEKVEHHLTEEERETFQLAGKALHEEEKQQLGLSYRANMEQARKQADLSSENVTIS